MGGLAPTDARVGLRITGHNAAGATSTLVYVSTNAVLAHPGLEAPQAPSVMQADPRVLASGAASLVALSLALGALVLCHRRRKYRGYGAILQRLHPQWFSIFSPSCVIQLHLCVYTNP